MTVDFETFIAPPEVRLPATLQQSPEQNWYQSQATVLYFLWDSMRRLGTSSSSIINDTDLGGPETFILVCSDETSFLTASTSKVTIRIPYNCRITDLRANVNTAPTGSTKLTVDIGQNGTSILTTKMTFDSGTKTTVGASVPGVLATNTLSDNDELRVDVTAIGSTVPGAGLKVQISLLRTS